MDYEVFKIQSEGSLSKGGERCEHCLGKLAKSESMCILTDSLAIGEYYTHLDCVSEYAQEHIKCYICGEHKSPNDLLVDKDLKILVCNGCLTIAKIKCL